MAVLTLAQLKALFQGITVELTGLNPNSGVRNTYPTQGQPAWKIDQNIVFIGIKPVDNQYDLLRDISYAPQPIVTGQQAASDQSTVYTRVMQVDWVVYGPDSFDLADTIRYGILTSETLATLQAVEVAPLTEIPAPVRAPELFDGQWWERSDVRAYFNVLTTRTATVPYLEAANIEVYTEKGLYGIIEIEE